MKEPVTIIAEAGINHDGDIERALALVDTAAEASADVVKFQTFRPTALASRHAPRASYQVRNDTTRQDDSQLAMLQRLALSDDEHFRLHEHCRARGIEFLSSPFDADSACFLIEDMALPRLKLGSGELTNAPLLLQIARSGRPLILSTGMAEPDEIRQALGVLAFGYLDEQASPSPATFAKAFEHTSGRAILKGKVTLLHCTSEYPVPFTDVNLRAMDHLRDAFGLPVGFSDHTSGIHISIAAAARGACVIEKHFTLNSNLPGPDHRASLEPFELRAMVEGIRQVEQALGDGRKRVADSERKNRAIARKSLVATRPIRAGEAFSENNLTAKRPGDGLAPVHYWSLLGHLARHGYAADEAIGEEELA
ncbi:MAG: N-acetylneuraminate synthase [Gammaproteobacteria bacterium]|nr:N-acetylneuraminate synthase [Gammaproteobacteria bacterium]MCF6363663.1 N-acetylneuraminate synthase [Gammaproteobacteria bacterium]